MLSICEPDSDLKLLAASFATVVRLLVSDTQEGISCSQPGQPFYWKRSLFLTKEPTSAPSIEIHDLLIQSIRLPFGLFQAFVQWNRFEET